VEDVFVVLKEIKEKKIASYEKEDYNE